MDRRSFLRLAGTAAGAGALGLLTACSDETRAPSLLLPGGSAGVLRAAPVELDLAGTVVTTWGYNGQVPGPEIRLRQGERVRVRLDNQLPEQTTVHWHGLKLPNPMDGVPDVTQPPVVPGGGFDYEFAAPDAGSFMYHAHVGHQMDRGLYGPFVVDDPDRSTDHDREVTLMLDDWDDGVVEHADGERGEHGEHGRHGAGVLREQPANPGPKTGGRSYPFILVNGRPPQDPLTIEAREGERLRLRVMNIAADTGFLFAIGGHRMTVTHSDGMPVEPVTVSALRLGMGERYDVVVEATDPGAWQVAVVPEAKRGFGRAVLRYTGSTASTPPVDARPVELTGRLLDYEDLRYAGERALPTGVPDRRHDLVLTTNEISGQRYPDADPLEVAEGEWVRITMRNTSAMWHPMHLHGHHFRVRTASGAGPLKDTMLVASGATASLEFQSDSPGRWMFHCHNHFHMERGMARVVSYAG